MSLYSHKLRKLNKIEPKESIHIESTKPINEFSYNWNNITKNTLLNEEVNSPEALATKFKMLNDVMRLYENNFRIMHWNSAGEEFNDGHVNITEKYYDMLAENIDKVSEIMGMLNIFPDGYDLDTLPEDNRFIRVDSNKYYSRKEAIEISEQMLNDISNLIVIVLEDQIINLPNNAGIKSELETLLYTIQFESRYLNKRKLGGSNSVEESYIIYSNLLECENLLINYLENYNVLTESVANKEYLDLTSKIKSIKNSKSQIQKEVEREVDCTNKSAVKKSVLQKIKDRLGSDKFSINNNRIVPAKIHSDEDEDENKKKNRIFIKIYAIALTTIAATIVGYILYNHLHKDEIEYDKNSIKELEKMNNNLDKMIADTNKELDKITKEEQKLKKRLADYKLSPDHEKYFKALAKQQEEFNNKKIKSNSAYQALDKILSDKNGQLIFDDKGVSGKTGKDKVISIDKYISKVMDD